MDWTDHATLSMSDTGALIVLEDGRWVVYPEGGGGSAFSSHASRDEAKRAAGMLLCSQACCADRE